MKQNNFSLFLYFCQTVWLWSVNEFQVYYETLMWGNIEAVCPLPIPFIAIIILPHNAHNTLNEYCSDAQTYTFKPNINMQDQWSFINLHVGLYFGVSKAHYCMCVQKINTKLPKIMRFDILPYYNFMKFIKNFWQDLNNFLDKFFSCSP